MVVGQPGKLVPVLRVVGSSPILVAKKKARIYAKYGIYPSFFIAFYYFLVISIHLKSNSFYPIFG